MKYENLERVNEIATDLKTKEPRLQSLKASYEFYAKEYEQKNWEAFGEASIVIFGTRVTPGPKAQMQYLKALIDQEAEAVNKLREELKDL